MASTREILQRLRNEPLHRTFTIEREAVKGETVKVSFASDRAIDHWFGRLKLSIDRKSVRHERLDAGLPVLTDHDIRQPVGVTGEYSFSGGKARTSIRFGNSDRAKEVRQDVLDGIRPNISVGFVIHSMVSEGKDQDGVEVFRSDDWEPYEISIVAVPADISVGIGRSIVRKNMSQQNEYFDGQSMAEQGFGPDLQAAAEIGAWGRALKEEASASGYIRSHTQNDGRFTGTKEGFFRHLKEGRPPAAVPPPMDPWMAAERHGGEIQLARSVPRYGKLKAFQGEGAEHRAYRFGQWILGGPMGNRAAAAWCQQNGVMLSRAQSEGLDVKGGFLVPEEFGQDIVQLMERYGVFRQHARIIPMSSDRRTDPIVNGELESEFVGELEEGTDQDLDFGMIGYTAKKHMVLVPYSSEISEDSAISIGDQLADASGRAFAYKEDVCGFVGDATSTYGGMVGITTNLKSVDANPANIAGLQVGSGNAYSELTLADFEGVVGRLPDFADEGNAKWFVSRRFYFNVMVKLLLSGAPTATEIEDARNRKFLGYPVVFTRVMPSTEANSQVCTLFGDLNLGARLADRRRFTTAIDESILFRKDALLFRATARFNVNSAYGVGDTTNAGPIVGLITAAA